MITRKQVLSYIEDLSYEDKNKLFLEFFEYRENTYLEEEIDLLKCKIEKLEEYISYLDNKGYE